MGFDRNLLPDPAEYFQERGLKLVGPRSAKWRTAECTFHGGSDSMRVNIQSGAFVCMAGCGARGGDVLGYEMAMTGTGFIESAKALGAWIDDGKPHAHHKPTPLSARDALTVLSFEVFLCLVAAGNLAQGVSLTSDDLSRLAIAAGRIQGIAEMIGGAS